MTGLRIFFRRRATLAVLIVVMAIAMRALVPAGFMTAASPAGLAIELCSGAAGKTVTIAIPSAPSKDHGKAQADGTCAFAALGLSGGIATDPIELAIAIVFILALGFARQAGPPPARSDQLRPPLRGPPLAA